ncbi:MAG: FemAB family XrtA/PEP-CTERM system-associated protein [Gemmatimonadota bacterium]
MEAAPPDLVEAASRPDVGWDAFVEATPGGSYCHLSGWGTIMNEVLGHEVLFLHARGREGALKGVLPLVRVRSRLFGHFLVSMPFLNYGGPLGSLEARRALAEWALAAAEGSGADLLELRARPGGEVEEGGLVVTGRKVTVVLPLPDDPEVLWKDGLRSKIRSQVRRPMKAGLEARFGPDQVEPFYRVFARNMRDLGTPVLPRKLFQALPGVFGDRVSFCVVYREGEPVAGGCGFLAAGEFEITWASALREHSKAAPNMLLYWRMMEHAIERGASAFNFGRCTPDTGSHRFKQQWGGEDVPLPWAAWSPDGRLATPNPEEGKFARAISIWQKLPVGLTRLIGPPLARRIP